MLNENETKETKVEEVKKPHEAAQAANIQDFIKEVKEKSMSKDEYEKVIAERDKAIEDRNEVIRSVIDGEKLKHVSQERKPIAELRETYNKVIHDRNATNLEVVTAQMNLRDALVEAGEPDPFAPYNATPDDLAAAKRVADVKRECIAQAEGDPKKFVYLFEQRIANDDPALLNAIKKRGQKRK